MDISDAHYDINVSEYLKRLRYVADLGCSTVMLTGTSEPQQNKQFLNTFALLHRLIGKPFTNIEMQTTGLFLTGNRDYVRFLRNFVGVNTVALSINALDDDMNNEILGHHLEGRPIKLKELCRLLKEYDFNVRLCYNLSSTFSCTVEDTFHFASECKADQITYRKLYTSETSTPQGKWIQEHQVGDNFKKLGETLASFQTIGHTVYGSTIKDVLGMSVIYDEDCMGKKPKSDALKYLILRPNCKLYSSWDSPASLVF